MRRDGGRSWAGFFLVAVAVALVLVAVFARAPRTSPAARPSATTVWSLPARGERAVRHGTRSLSPAALLAAAPLLERARALLRGPLRVIGVVVDEEGLAVAGARVLGAPDGGAGEFDLSSVTETHTDSAGRFDLTLPAEYRLVALRAEADDPSIGSATLRQLGAPKWGAMDVGTIVLVPSRVVAGRVVDVEGAPLSGATVTFESRHAWSVLEVASVASVESDAAGEFGYSGPEPVGRVRAALDGYARASVDIAAAPRDVEIVLERECVLRGRVVDSRGVPVEGASVWPHVPPGLGVTSGVDGAFVVRALPEGPGIVHALALGRCMGEARYEARRDEEAFVEIELADTAIVSGLVIDAATGEPLAGAIVHPGDVVTGEDGRFRVSRIWPRSGDDSALTVIARRVGFAPRQARAESGSELRIELEREAIVRGLLLDSNGSPISGALLTLHTPNERRSARATSDGEGRFVFSELSPDEYSLPSVYCEGLPRQDPDGTFTVASGETHELTLVIGHGRGVRGRVTAADGTPVAGARVSLWRFANETWFQDVDAAPTSERGRFEIRGVGPGATRLVARAGRGGFAPIVIPVDLPEEGRAEVDIALERGEVIEGIVLRSDGGSTRGARVFWQFDGSEILWASGYADADREGRFRLEGVVAGEVRLSCTLMDGDYYVAHLTLRPPFEPVTITLAPLKPPR